MEQLIVFHPRTYPATTAFILIEAARLCTAYLEAPRNWVCCYIEANPIMELYRVLRYFNKGEIRDGLNRTAEFLILAASYPALTMALKKGTSSFLALVGCVLGALPVGVVTFYSQSHQNSNSQSSMPKLSEDIISLYRSLTNNDKNR